MNYNTGGYSKTSSNMNEIFKLTCQRYHSYITQIMEFLKNIEIEGRPQTQSKGGKKEENFDQDFSFMPSTWGLASKVKGMPKNPPQDS